NPGRDSRLARCMQVWRMRTGISIALKPVDRRRLTTVAGDRNAPHKHVWRAEIVLFSGDGVGTMEIMRRTGKSKTCVWRWQERFVEQGDAGLLMAVALHVLLDDRSVERVEGGEERGGAVALVVVGHRAGATLPHRQAGLGAVKRRDLA